MCKQKIMNEWMIKHIINRSLSNKLQNKNEMQDKKWYYIVIRNKYTTLFYIGKYNKKWFLPPTNNVVEFTDLLEIIHNYNNNNECDMYLRRCKDITHINSVVFHADYYLIQDKYVEQLYKEFNDKLL